MNIFEEGRYDNSHKYEMIVQVSSLLLTLNISKEDAEEVILPLQAAAARDRRFGLLPSLRFLFYAYLTQYQYVSIKIRPTRQTGQT